MRHIRIHFLMLFLTLAINQTVLANEPDSVYLFSYATVKDKGHSGLHFAWSVDGKKWNLVGNEYGFVKCDYGPWGQQKQINSPYLFQNANGEWQCVWSLNDTVSQFASVASADLINWKSQEYPYLQKSQSFRQPVVHYDKNNNQYVVAFISGSQYLKINTQDFKNFDSPINIPASEYKDDRITVNLPAGVVTGNISKVPWEVVAKLNNMWQLKQYKMNQEKESPRNDSIKFAGLKPLAATITLKPENSKSISDLLTGVFFEDINYSADGGLYAELLQNRDFEYTPVEKLFRDTSWNSKHSWTTKGNINFTIDGVSPVHPNNPHYAVLNASQPGGALINSGYDGIVLIKGDSYDFSLFAKNSDSKSKNLVIKLVTPDGGVLAKATVNINSPKWKKY